MDINEKINYKLTNATKAPVVLPGHGAWDNDKRRHQHLPVTLGCKLDEKVAGSAPHSITLPGAQAKALLAMRSVRALIASSVLTLSTGQNIIVDV